jgi:N utilization substance protein A
MNAELVRHIDGIARDKGIDKENVYVDIEQAIASGLRKHFDTEELDEFQVSLDRLTGEITAYRLGEPVPLSTIGRIGAQTVKQVMIQLLRADERGSIYDEYKDRVGTIVTGNATRFEGPLTVVNLGRTEGIMPRSEQIPGERHEDGDRIQALITEVRDTPGGVKIILSRGHPEMIRRLFEREVPEVGERTIEIKALAREPGRRTKVAVASVDAKVDPVGACVGVRGSRIRNIVDELGGEKIDIVRWNESSQVLIANALKPAVVAEVALCFELSRATVVVQEDQLSLAIGKHGQNVRLAARLTGWDVDIITPQEYQDNIDRLDRTLQQVAGVDQDIVDKVIALGLIDVRDVEEVGEGPLMEEVGVSDEMAEQMVDVCVEEAKIVMKEVEAKKLAEEGKKDGARSALLADPIAPFDPAAQTDPAASAEPGDPTGAALLADPVEANTSPAEQAAAEATAPTGTTATAPGAGYESPTLQDGKGTENERPADAPEAPEASEPAAEPTRNEPIDTTGDGVANESGGHVPGAMEHTDGMAPELVTHSPESLADSDELSPEERAIHMPDGSDMPEGHDSRDIGDDEDSEEAALAEGRLPPPAPQGQNEQTV